MKRLLIIIVMMTALTISALGQTKLCERYEKFSELPQNEQSALWVNGITSIARTKKLSPYEAYTIGRVTDAIRDGESTKDLEVEISLNFDQKLAVELFTFGSIFPAFKYQAENDLAPHCSCSVGSWFNGCGNCPDTAGCRIGGGCGFLGGFACDGMCQGGS